MRGQKCAEYELGDISHIPITKWKLTSLDFLYSTLGGTFDPYGLEEKDYNWYEFETNLGNIDLLIDYGCYLELEIDQ